MAKKARRAEVDSDLNINSMMDMMTIILVFLLKSYGNEDIQVAPSEDLRLPSSSAIQAPEVAVNVVVSRSQIVVDGEPVLDLALEEGVPVVPEDAMRGNLISQLQEVLEEKADDAKAIAERSPDHPFEGRLLLQCDRSTPFSLVRSVMYTAGQAHFGQFKFVVYKTSE